MARIVVGIDGSDGSARALRWAVDEARLREAEVEAVHTYVHPVGAYPFMVPAEDDAALRDAAQRVIDDAVAAVPGAQEVVTQRTVSSGGAAGALCETAAGADLMVVGARGLGGFRGLLLGSVSQQVVTHAPCPVVVVGPDRT